MTNPQPPNNPPDSQRLSPPELLSPAGSVECARAAVGAGADAVYFGIAADARSLRERVVVRAPGDRPALLSSISERDLGRAEAISCFNARARAANVPLDGLADLVAWLHRYGVKAYVTLNTLVFPKELERFEAVVRRVAEAGVDAVLVQDLGAARLARAVCPDLPLHASTQMSLTSAEGIRAVESLGIERVILARELSLDDIGAIRRQTRLALEVFVHGALCISYSGQCLASRTFGPRSANRGDCAQVCRLPYELICDEAGESVGNALRGVPGRGMAASGSIHRTPSMAIPGTPRRAFPTDGSYLLSPSDLAAYTLVPDLIRAGVAALKIEGRLKSPDYVAVVTRHYRRAIDAAVAGRSPHYTDEELRQLEATFSRGFSLGWLEGSRPKALVTGRSSSKHGERLGEVKGVVRGRVEVALSAPVKRGDGVVFEAIRPGDFDQGGRVYAVYVGGRRAEAAVSEGVVELGFARDAIRLDGLCRGQVVWKTLDPALVQQIRRSRTGIEVGRRVALDLVVEATPGQPLRVSGRAGSGASCAIESSGPLQQAVKHRLTEPVLREHLGRLGHTPYELRRLEANIAGGPMVPLSVLGEVRRAMIAALDASVASAPRTLAAEPQLERLRAVIAGAVAQPPSAVPALPSALPALPSALPALPSAVPALPSASTAGGGGATSREGTAGGGGATASEPVLHVLCRSAGQLRAVLEAGVGSVVVEDRDLAAGSEAVRDAHRHGTEIFLATPRVQRPGETWVFEAIAGHRPDGVLARNLAALAFFTGEGIPVVADFSLNAANELTVAWLHDRGAARVTASYDLRRSQLFDLVAAVPPEWLEVVVHLHVPMFHTEYCLWCAHVARSPRDRENFVSERRDHLSAGTSRTDCGRPCRRHSLRLKDRKGAEHVAADDGLCRTTVYHAVAQSAAESVPLLLERGVRHFRIELLPDQTGPEIPRILEIYSALMACRVSGQEAWRCLQTVCPAGITRGTLR